jgi:cyclopropane fatty-acyl-phospholipid synthase-like methyltransferase
MSKSPTSGDNLFQIVESGYDKISEAYLTWSRGRRIEERIQLLDRFIALLPIGASVLELGCGAGVPITQHLVKSKLQVTGVDISKEQIDLAKQYIPGAAFIQANMFSTDFEAEVGGTSSFDSVIAMYSFFHIPLHLQDEMLAKMIAWLKPGGILFFNHNADEGENFYQDWMGAPMFSCSSGVEGMRLKLAQHGDSVNVLEDRIIAEPVGKNKAMFHYTLLQKRGSPTDS